MFRKKQILLATHLLALGLAYTVAGNTARQASKTGKPPPLRTKSSARDSQISAGGDGARLLAGFTEEQSEKKSRYDELKASLPVAEDLKAAALKAMEKWKSASTQEERAEYFPELEVRMLHWMRRNPEEVMDFITNTAVFDPERAELSAILRLHVFKDVALEKGVLQSLGWMTRSRVSSSVLRDVVVSGIKDGGGLALFVKLEEQLGGEALKDLSQIGFQNQEDIFRSVGRVIPFNEKEQLLEYVGRQQDNQKKRSLLLGFAQSGEPAVAWVLGLIGRGELEGEVAAGLKSSLGNEVLSTPSMDMDKRVEARRATKGNENKDSQSIINEIVGGDVNRLLVNGRDWRYEFRNGVASLDDVMTAVRGGLPGIPPEGEEALRISLYRQLSEENPKKALALLDTLTEEKRREVLFSNTWQSHANNNPEDFMRFLSGLPEPVTPKEKDERIKGWNWKARGCLARYGDDYVEWVKAMPPGIDKDTAMSSLVWATREQNPAKARELNAQLYPKKP